MNTFKTTYDDPALCGDAIAHDRARELLGHVIGYVAFVATHGAYGYATRRGLTSWARTLLRALLGLLVFGIVAIFAMIPNDNISYAVAGLGIFGAVTIFNVFLLALDLFGGQRD